MKNTDYYRENAVNTKNKQNLNRNNLDFTKIIAIAQSFSKYLFAKGGIALYAPDKVNFLKV